MIAHWIVNVYFFVVLKSIGGWIDEMTMIIDLIVYDNGVAQWKMKKNINAQTKPKPKPNQTERNGWNEKRFLEESRSNREWRRNWHCTPPHTIIIIIYAGLLLLLFLSLMLMLSAALSSSMISKWSNKRINQNFVIRCRVGEKINSQLSFPSIHGIWWWFVCGLFAAVYVRIECFDWHLCELCVYNNRLFNAISSTSQ